MPVLVDDPVAPALAPGDRPQVLLVAPLPDELAVVGVPFERGDERKIYRPRRPKGDLLPRQPRYLVSRCFLKCAGLSASPLARCTSSGSSQREPCDQMLAPSQSKAGERSPASILASRSGADLRMIANHCAAYIAP